MERPDGLAGHNPHPHGLVIDAGFGVFLSTNNGGRNRIFRGQQTAAVDVTLEICVVI